MSDFSSAIPSDTRARIQHLANTLLDRYQVYEPPVPIEDMLKHPLDALWQPNPSKISFIVGHGLYRYAPRMGEARLLYRLICDNADARRAGLDAPWPAARREIKYFARCLLMPEDWIRQLPESDRIVDAISERFQVTTFDAVIRLAELGYSVPNPPPIKSP